MRREKFSGEIHQLINKILKKEGISRQWSEAIKCAMQKRDQKSIVRIIQKEITAECHL